MTFKGGLLRDARLKARLSRPRLSELIRLYYGVSIHPETIRRHEAGNYWPQLQTAAVYSRVLGISIDSMITR